MENTIWEAFRKINANRRSIRDFDNSAIPDDDIKEILMEAGLAPSSGNSLPYEFHWIKTQELKDKVALACNGQRGAASASTLVVLVASTGIAKKSLHSFKNYIENSEVMSEKSKTYYLKSIDILTRFLKIGPLIFWTSFLNIFSLILPALSLLPVGGIGVRQWCSKNSIFAAQNFMLAASAKGYDSCPMEGFNARKIASLLKLPYGSVIPVVIALGKRTDNALLDGRWRRPFEDAVVIH